MLVSMELHLDASIDKLDREEAERVDVEGVYLLMVAETQEYQYNADVFEARGAMDVK